MQFPQKTWKLECQNVESMAKGGRSTHAIMRYPVASPHLTGTEGGKVMKKDLENAADEIPKQ